MSGGYLLFVSSPAGYSIREREGDPPQVGEELDDEGRTIVISKVGRSPIPGDTRPCAYSFDKS